jgi:hypothetical protein
LLPGIGLLAVVGYAGKFVEHFINAYGKAHHLVLPNIEYVLWAILFGILIANTVGLPRIFRAGVATYEFWLRRASSCLARASSWETSSSSVASRSSLSSSRSRSR